MTVRLLAALLLAIATPAASQLPAAPSLGELQAAAVESDPRQAQVGLLT